MRIDRAAAPLRHHRAALNHEMVRQELIDEGYPIIKAVIARLVSCRTEHINWFGCYKLRLDQIPEPLMEDLYCRKFRL